MPLARLTPGGKGIWNNCEFFIEDGAGTFDWWFVFDNLHKNTRATGPRDRTVLILGETDTIKTYPQWFLDQFGYIVAPQRGITHPRVIHYRIPVPWAMGERWARKDRPSDYLERYFSSYDDLKSRPWPQKTKLLSAIVTRHSRTAGQLARHRFVGALKSHFGERMDVFGAGVNHIVNKWDGIAPYRYHLALEHTSAPDYMTEKLHDAYLGYAFPFYYGCTNPERYYDPSAFIKIDIKDPEGAIRTIEDAVARNTYERRKDALAAARQKALDTNSFFPWMASFCEEHRNDPAGKIGHITLKRQPDPLIPKIVARLRSVPLLYSISRWIFRTYRRMRRQVRDDKHLP